MTDVMVDIETLGVRPRSIILTIGAIKFTRDPNVPKLEEMETFYRRVDIESCKKIGMHVEIGTQRWWDSQEQDVRYEALENKDREPIAEVLEEFRKWFGSCKYIWSHGDDFDCSHLSEAFALCNRSAPWDFWNTRDTRTIYDIAGISVRKLPQTLKHHALHDCYRQIIGVKKALARLFA